MESRQRIKSRRVRRMLRTLAALAFCGILTNSASADVFQAKDYASLNEGLASAQEKIVLAPEGEGATGITLGGNLLVGAANTVDLAGFSLIQNANKLSFGAENLNLTITDSTAAGGSLLNFTGFTAADGSQAGTVTLNALTNTFGSDFSVNGVSLALTGASKITAAGKFTTSNLTASDASTLNALNLDASSGFTGTLSGASSFLISVDETSTTDEESGETSYVINNASTGTAVLGNAGDTNAHIVMNISGGSVFGVYSAVSDAAVGGKLDVFLQNGDVISVDSAESSAQSAFVVGKTTNLTALGTTGMALTNGSYASLGDLTLTAASGNSAVFTVDGSGTFTSEEGSGNAASTLVLKSYTKTGDGNAVFKVQNGGALYVQNDFTLDDTTTLTRDTNAAAGSLLSVAGKLTLNNSLTIGTAAGSDLNSVTANVLDAAGKDGAMMTFTVQNGSKAQFGQVLGAQGDGSTLNVTLSGESQFGAFTNEEDTSGDWTGVLTLGGADGGHVNLALSDKSTLVAGTTGVITLQNGDAVTVAGGSQIYGGKSLSLLGDSGTSTINVTDTSSIYSDGTLFLGANDGGTLKITASGKDAENLAHISAKGDFTLGGAGTTDVNVGNYTTLGTDTNMVFGDNSEGTVSFKIAGDKSYVYVGPASSTESGDDDGDDDDADNGKIIVAQHGTVNLDVADSAAVVAVSDLVAGENEDAEAIIKLSNKGALQSGGEMILGKNGTAQVTGSGTIVSAGKLVVGQNANETASSVNLSNSYVESAGLVVGESAGSKGSFTLTGKGSTLHIKASDAALTSAGNGTVNISGVTSTDFSSCVYLENKGGIYANGGITMSDTYLYLGSDTVLSAADGGTKFTNGSIINGFTDGMNAAGDVSIKDSTFIMGLGLDGTSNNIVVKDGSLSVEGSKLELYFTADGNITGTEWLVAEVDSTDANDKITGEWDVASPLEIYTFSQYITEDGKKQYLTQTLKNEYFNVRANSLQLARQSLWTEVEDRISWNTSGQAYCGEKSPFFSYDQRASFWAKSGYRGTDVKGVNGFNTDAFTLSLGADCAFEEYFAAGAFAAFSNPELEEDHETAEANNYSFGAYGGYKTWGGFELKGMFGYTFSDYDLNRNMGTAGTAEASFRGSALTASVEIAHPFEFGAFVLRPLFAVDTECVWQNEATESGAYAMYYEKSDDTWTYARLGAKFDFAPAQRFILRGKAFYALQLDDNDATKTVGYFNGSSSSMTLVGADVGDDYFNVGLTAAFMCSENVSIFADYDGYYSDESEAHLVHGGFQINF